MTIIKENSTIQANKQIAQECPITYTLEKIRGYWKPTILFFLLSGSKRYSDLRKSLPHITEKMLSQDLRHLENDRLVERTVVSDKPLVVSYGLTSTGMAMKEVLNALGNWAMLDNSRLDIKHRNSINVDYGRGDLPVDGGKKAV